MNLTQIRQKLTSPMGTLVIVILLNLSRRLEGSLPWTRYPRELLWLWVGYYIFFRPKGTPDAPPPPGKVIKRVISYAATLFLGFGLIIYFASPSQLLPKDLSSSPLQAIADVGSPEVMLGFDKLTIYQDRGWGFGTISYYTDDGRAVAMAHAIPDLEPGPLPIALQGTSYFDRQTAQLISNDDSGILLKLEHLPSPLPERLPIGGPGDITVGETAQLHSLLGGSFPVRIQGYTVRKGQQYLVIQSLDRANHIIHGMSGSPIVQNGKLIGCMSAISGIEGFPRRSPDVGMARLAADMFAATSQKAAQ